MKIARLESATAIARRATSSTVPPAAAASAAASAANPSPIATVRESTTRTGTGERVAASAAACTVPDRSPDRWIETIDRAPAPAAAS